MLVRTDCISSVFEGVDHNELGGDCPHVITNLYVWAFCTLMLRVNYQAEASQLCQGRELTHQP